MLSSPGQPPRYHIWNVQWIPVSNQGGTMFIMSNQLKGWATNMFIILYEQPTIFLSSSLANLRCAKEGREMQVEFYL